MRRKAGASGENESYPQKRRNLFQSTGAVRVDLGNPLGAYFLAIAIAAVALGWVSIITHNNENSENILEDIRKESV
ncbi:MAG: hypothetical protein IKL22_09900 [Lachnospiraceae bacterium]|nr:hypothetical protein [Lachnospiraceae bacterium]